MRQETDSLGSIDVPDDALWGAQSQRSLQNFKIGNDRFPDSFIHAFALVKKAAATSNEKLGLLDKNIAKFIRQACDEIIAGQHANQFPLSVWQTGSGTQTNMNLNEVIANRCSQLAGKELGSKTPAHPNNHVNMSQSSNDVFPTVMHLVTVQICHRILLPALNELITVLGNKASEFRQLVKIGRTHMMDATPLTLGNEFSAYAQQQAFSYQQLEHSLKSISELAIGGTAVGTGLNSPPQWAELVSNEISKLSGFSFRSAENKFSQLAAHDALTNVHAVLNLLAGSLYKMASDIRLMSSGPRCGLAEIEIPANEPGSSIMPGKVNPTQVEALTMVCLRVSGNNVTINAANSQGQFELNVYKPVIIHCLIESMTLLSDAISSFTENCLKGIKANHAQLKSNIDRSLMLVTALSPTLGYDKAAKVATHAHKNNLSLKQAVVELGFLDADEFDARVNVDSMLGPG